MTTLQKMALSQIKEEIAKVESILMREKTDPAECGRTGTPTSQAAAGLMQAIRWIRAIEEQHP